MTYKDFKLADLQSRFGIQNRMVTLFSKIQPLQASQALLDQLAEARSQPVKSEKARSELLVMPILMELRKRNDRFFNVHSGEYLNVDRENGLYGECDFLLGKNIGSYTIEAPLISVVEAKKQDIEFGINQCAAQMIGSQKFNESKGKALPFIYGCVTTGDAWAFLRLSGRDLEIDPRLHSIDDLDNLLGIFQQMLDYYKATI